MNVIGCLDLPTSGSYFLDGLDVAGLGPDDLAAQRRAVADLGLPGWMWWDPTNLYRYSNGPE